MKRFLAASLLVATACGGPHAPTVRRFPLPTGSALKPYDPARPGEARPNYTAQLDGIVYAGSTANRIIGVDARSGRIVFHFPHGEYVPVSGDGARLLLHGYSRLYAVEPKRK